MRLAKRPPSACRSIVRCQRRADTLAGIEGVLWVNSNSSVRPSTPSGGCSRPASASSSACRRWRATPRSRTSPALRDEIEDLDGKVVGGGGGRRRDGARGGDLFTAEGARRARPTWNASAAEETVGLCSGEAFASITSQTRYRCRGYGRDRERFGGIECSTTTPSISPDDDTSILDTPVEAWQRVQDVNTKGFLLQARHSVPAATRRGGSVINVAAPFVAAPSWEPATSRDLSYTASKGAVLSMSRELAVQFAARDPGQRPLPGTVVDAPLLLNIFGGDPCRARPPAHPLADRPARQAARDRQRRPLPRERRVFVRQRDDVPRRRRTDRLVRTSE